MAQFQRLVILSHQLSADRLALTPEQQHYLVRVLRLRQGNIFIAMDGQGREWSATLTDDPAYAQLLEPISVQPDSALPVNLLLAMPKTGMDDVVRQATELGVAQILPVLSQRTLLKPSQQKLERWQRIAQEAAEQSERAIVPQVWEPQEWNRALHQWNASNSRCYLCEARGEHPHLLSCLLNEVEQPSTSITLAIGSEGGWTEAEIAAAVAVGYQPVSLGSRILRAVTAPLVALSLVASVIESMSEKGKGV